MEGEQGLPALFEKDQILNRKVHFLLTTVRSNIKTQNEQKSFVYEGIAPTPLNILLLTLNLSLNFVRTATKHKGCLIRIGISLSAKTFSVKSKVLIMNSIEGIRFKYKIISVSF